MKNPVVWYLQITERRLKLRSRTWGRCCRGLSHNPLHLLMWDVNIVKRHAACFAPRYIYVTFDTQMNLRLLRRHYPLTLHPAEWAQHIKNSAALPAWPFLFALFCLQARPGVWLRNHNFLRRFFTVLKRFLKRFSLWLELRPIEMFFKTLYRRVYWGKMMQPEKEAIVQNAWKSLHLKAT